MQERTNCPRCDARLVLVREGIFQWKACPKCPWDVFANSRELAPPDEANGSRRA